MASGNERFGGEAAHGGRVLEALGDAVQQMALETVRREFQEIKEHFERQMQEALRQQELKLREEFGQQLRDTLREQKRIVTRLRRLEEGAGNASPGGEKERQCLEARVGKLEASVGKALEKVFPRVDALLYRLEKPSPPKTSHSASAPRPSPLVVALPVPMHAQPLSREELNKKLFLAARDGSVSAVRKLLVLGAEVNAFANGGTPLLLATMKCHPDVVQQLLERGADVHAKTSFGCSALHLGAEKDRSGECIALLIGAGAHVSCMDAEGLTPLHVAVRYENEAAVRALLLAGARRSAEDFFNRTPLSLAKSDSIRLLIEYLK